MIVEIAVATAPSSSVVVKVILASPLKFSAGVKVIVPFVSLMVTVPCVAGTVAVVVTVPSISAAL